MTGQDDSGTSGGASGTPEQVRPLTAEQQKLQNQLELVIGNPQKGIPGIPGIRVHPDNWLELGYFDYLYRENYLLVRDHDAERVVRDLRLPVSLRRRGVTSHVAFTPDPRVDDDDSPVEEVDLRPRERRDPASDQPPDMPSLSSVGTRGLTMLELEPTHDDPRVTWTVPMWCAAADDQFGPGVVTPDHLLYMVPAVSHCPATEPESVRAHARPVPDALPSVTADQRDVSVVILDSGWFKEAGDQHEWLRGVRGKKEHTYVGGTAQIRDYSGHGTFCAGVLRSVAPRTDVYVAKTFYLAGGVFESDIAPQVVHAVSAGADVLSLSAGTHTRNDLPLLGFEIVKETIDSYKGVVLVCAAGNDSSRQPFFPAALDWTVSVGALSTDWEHRAWFTNYGGWVDCYAPGEDLINAFPTGFYVCNEPPNVGQVRRFGGMARWSGTSFSTPMVAGFIAARMARTGENGKEAAKAVLREARENFRPGVGPVLLPGHHAEA